MRAGSQAPNVALDDIQNTIFVLGSGCHCRGWGQLRVLEFGERSSWPVIRSTAAATVEVNARILFWVATTTLL